MERPDHLTAQRERHRLVAGKQHRSQLTLMFSERGPIGELRQFVYWCGSPPETILKLNQGLLSKTIVLDRLETHVV